MKKSYKSIWLLVISILFSSFLLTGCSAVTEMHAFGGSKADGIVEMSYEYAPLQPIKIDKEKALASATKRCNAWGYETAESFDAGQRS